MPERRPYIAGNWKMYKTASQASSFVGALLSELDQSSSAEVGLCVPFTALAAAVEAARGTDVRIAAQNMHQATEGPYTGEVSAPMLAELGAEGVVLGHSERRQYNCETDEALAEKVPAALASGLEPILCVGESEAERHANQTESRLRTQVHTALCAVESARVAELVIAYEPVWAIGTGNVATPDIAQEAICHIRALVAELFGAGADAVRILYGGSVKPETAGEICAQPDIDGALVGGASLDPEVFAAIVRAA